MAIGDPYGTLADLKIRLGVKDSDTVDDDGLTEALAAASRCVEAYCGRQFNQDTTATARTYHPTRAGLAIVDDFYTTTGLVVKTGDDGTFDTTWPATDYQLEPLNEIRHGEAGWPFWKLRAVESELFPLAARATLEVTAQWGWAAVPGPVKEATYLLAAELFKAKDAPFGVAGFGEYGAVRVRDNPMAKSKLVPYRRNAVLVA